MYYGEFKNRADILREFAISDFEGDVVHAQYDCVDYDGSAHVIFINRGKFYIVQGGHCSCYGLEENQWEPEETSPEALLHIIRNGDVYGISKNESLANCIERLIDLLEEDSSQDEIEVWMRLML